jgi:hypothetical protein
LLSDATLNYAESLTPALLGVDALCRRPGGDDDGLVVVNMSQRHHALPMAGFAEARGRLIELREAASVLPEPDRREYYRQVCDSTIALLDWRERGLPFEEQIRRFLHLPAEPAAEAELERLRTDMRVLLSGLGYDGDLAAQCASWERRHRVPSEEVIATVEALLDEAWDRTMAVLPIPVSRSDGMRVAGVHGTHFNARCDYIARTVELNLDPVLTGPSLKHLVVHECYPGHYVQFKLREHSYMEGTAGADGLLSLVNSASSSVFEGIADHGLRMLRWVQDDDDRIAACLTRYRAGIGTGAAWRLHVLGWLQDQVAEWLRANCLFGGEGWIQNRMQFIAAPQRSVLIWSYWAGEPAVEAAWDVVPAGRRHEFLRFLYGRMHSVRSVGMFSV